MKRIGKWLLGLITSALTLVLVIVLLPYAAKWVARIMPDESAAAIRASVVLSQKLEQSATRPALPASPRTLRAAAAARQRCPRSPPASG